MAAVVAVEDSEELSEASPGRSSVGHGRCREQRRVLFNAVGLLRLFSSSEPLLGLQAPWWYFSCCDKLPGQKRLKGERVYLSHNSIVRTSSRQELEAADSIPSEAREQWINARTLALRVFLPLPEGWLCRNAPTCPASTVFVETNPLIDLLRQSEQWDSGSTPCHHQGYQCTPLPWGYKCTPSPGVTNARPALGLQMLASALGLEMRAPALGSQMRAPAHASYFGAGHLNSGSYSHRTLQLSHLHTAYFSFLTP